MLLCSVPIRPAVQELLTPSRIRGAASPDFPNVILCCPVSTCAVLELVGHHDLHSRTRLPDFPLITPTCLVSILRSAGAGGPSRPAQRPPAGARPPGGGCAEAGGILGCCWLITACNRWAAESRPERGHLVPDARKQVGLGSLCAQATREMTTAANSK